MKKHIISLAILLASGISVFGQNTTYLSEIRPSGQCEDGSQP